MSVPVDVNVNPEDVAEDVETFGVVPNWNELVVEAEAVKRGGRVTKEKDEPDEEELENGVETGVPVVGNVLIEEGVGVVPNKDGVGAIVEIFTGEVGWAGTPKGGRDDVPNRDAVVELELLKRGGTAEVCGRMVKENPDGVEVAKGVGRGGRDAGVPKPNMDVVVEGGPNPSGNWVPMGRNEGAVFCWIENPPSLKAGAAKGFLNS